MSEPTRNIAICFYLTVTVLCGALFLYATDGFYGTNAPSFWKALHPTTVAQSDDVFLCNSMNGEGSDDAVFPFLLVLLSPLIFFRLVRLQVSPSWVEVSVFMVLSLPFFLGMFTGLATCADIALTLYVGKNFPLGFCLVGWVGAAVFYLLKINRPRL